MNDEDKRNIDKIVKVLNANQNNSDPPRNANTMIRDVWNLSDFGFAFEITKAVPCRYLRIRALKKLLNMTRSSIVVEQINKYLENPSKYDSNIADGLAFELKELRFKMLNRICHEAELKDYSNKLVAWLQEN